MSDAIFEALCATFDQLGLAVCILSEGGRVLFANRRAQAMFEKGWPVGLADGCLQGRDRAVSAELKRLIEALGSASPDTDVQEYELCLAQSSEEQKGAMGCLRRLTEAQGAETTIALFVAETGQTSQYGIDGFAAAYELSKAETRILKAFVEVQTPAEAAARLNIAPSTVKSHLRKIFHKTNTSRQAELLRLVECCRTPFRKSEV
jgi:DNA-binding CsgD family transcriptional regulator